MFKSGDYIKCMNVDKGLFFKGDIGITLGCCYHCVTDELVYTGISKTDNTIMIINDDCRQMIYSVHRFESVEVNKNPNIDYFSINADCSGI